jgi:hypothetical protein
VAFSDWDTFFTGNYIVVNEAFSTITPPRSLRIENTSPGGTAGGVATPSVASGFTRGITAGRLRTSMRKDAGANDSLIKAGIFFLSSTTNPLIATTTCYSVAVSGAGDVSIFHHATNLPTVSNTLATAASHISNLGSNFILEAMWFYDAVEFGGTRIEVKVNGTLVPGLAIIDTTFGLSSTGGEGLYSATDGGSQAQFWLFDDTRLFSVVIE